MHRENIWHTFKHIKFKEYVFQKGYLLTCDKTSDDNQIKTWNYHNNRQILVLKTLFFYRFLITAMINAAYSNKKFISRVYQYNYRASVQDSLQSSLFRSFGCDF